ncbi:MAG: transporter associated domain-containing protein [Thermotaleaceae bacterium]
MHINRFKGKILKLTYYLEVALAAFITLAIIIGMIDLFKYLGLVYQTNTFETYDVFQKFLGHVLLLVVGVELVIMLVLHTTGSVLEVVLYAIARKMLIYSSSMVDFLLGVAAIASVFAIRKYLFIRETFDERSGQVFSAATPIAEANSIIGLNIPLELGNTVGGLVSHLSQETSRPVYEGVEYTVASAKIKVIKMNDGLIEKVLVSHE